MSTDRKNCPDWINISIGAIGLEILTGMPAGEPDKDGAFPKGTLNRLVMTRLDEIAEAVKPEKNNKTKPKTKPKTARKKA